MSRSIDNEYENFIALSRYARWIESEGRRETWGETVDRYFSFMLTQLKEKHKYIPSDKIIEELRDAVFNRNVMPSMRSVMTAGVALERENVSGYNCAFLPVDSPRSFDETMYILMCGTGVGFSVEYKYINKLPPLPETLEKSSTTVIVGDSKEGWAKAYRELLSLLWAGQIPQIDISKVRPAGARLKTMGGRSSGPQPLINLFDFTIQIFKNALGRQLKPIECHDLMCKIGEVVVVGGVRRSAMISLSNINDIEMAQAKSGNWWETNSQRALSNNSVAYSRKPEMQQFISEWKSLYDSKSGERGIYNVAAAQKQAAKFGRRNPEIHYGTNPSLAPGTLVWTTEGVFPIEVLQDKSFYVRNLDGKISEAKCWLSGKDKNLFRLNLEGGHYYDATAEHKWAVITEDGITKKNTPDLVPGDKLVNLKKDFLFDSGTEGTYVDGFAMGWNLGDGWATERKFGLQIGFIVAGKSDRESNIHGILTDYFSQNGSKSSLIEKEEVNVNNNSLRQIWKDFGFKHKSLGIAEGIWRSQTSEDYRKGYIDGIFSSDGSVEPEGRIRLVSAHEKLLRDVAALLGFYGIKTTVRKRSNSILNGKEFESWVLGVNGYSNIKRFSSIFTLSNKEKQSKIVEFLKEKSYKPEFDKTDYILVVSVEDTEMQSDVWDISVNDESHAFQLAHCITGNCSEIILRPYQFCVTANTPLITRTGIFDIGLLEDKKVEVWNGDNWSEVTVRKTRKDSEIVRVLFSDGSYLDCTPDHKFSVKDRFQGKWTKVEAKDLMTFSRYSVQVQSTKIAMDSSGIDIADPYTLGFAVGDGFSYKGVVSIDLYGEKDFKCPVEGVRHKTYTPKGYNLEKTRVRTSIDPVLFDSVRSDFRQLSSWSKDSVLKFVAGLADADGSSVISGGIRIYISGEERARDMQLVLTKNGIRSSVNLASKRGSLTNKGKRKRDLWYLQITDARDLSCSRIDTSRGHDAKFKGKFQNVVSVTLLSDKEDVFCFNEPINHMAVFGNVLTYQCNLSEVVLREKDTIEDITNKVRLASILGTWQSTLTDFKYIRKIWKDNTEEERLLGVSLTGQFGHKFFSGQEGLDKLGDVLSNLRQWAVDVNIEEASKIGIPASAAVTCVKPSGCQIPDTMIISDNGILELGEIGAVYGPSWQDIALNVRSDVSTTGANKFKANGIADVKHIMMKSGLDLTATFNHMYRVWENSEYVWKRADEIKVGDKIPYVQGGYNKTSEPSLSDVSDTYHNNGLIKFPSKMNPDLAWLLGVYFGDGSNHDRGIRFSCNSNNLNHIEKIERIVFQQFGVVATRDKKQNANCISVNFNRNTIIDWLSSNGILKQKTQDIEIPLLVRSSSKESLESFLDGYCAADGHINQVGRSFVSTSYFMAKQVATILRALGHDSSLRLMPPTSTSYGTNMRYWVQEKKGLNGKWMKRNDYKSILELKKAGFNDMLIDTVINIEDSVEFTVDISVPEGNTYLSNSYVSHNTVSQLVGVSSGMHTYHSEYYIRTVRGDKKDPITQFLKDVGIPSEDDAMKPSDTLVFSFPVKSPKNAVTRNDLTAIQHLELWLTYQRHWCEHKPSITVSVDEDEWMEVGAWVYKHFDEVSGISFLPKSNHTYVQAPYQEITKEQYEEVLAKMPKSIDWSVLSLYEIEDSTTGTQAFACVASDCEIVDISSN